MSTGQFLARPGGAWLSGVVQYFDHNATHPLSRTARAAWLEAVDRFPGNPSSPHRLGSRADHALETARERLAGWLGCSPFDLVWTSGATEAVNTVLHHVSVQGEGEVWVSAVEHPCVLAATEHWFPRRHQRIPVTAEGLIDLEWLSRGLERSKPRLVAVMAANNETGILQPWTQVRALCQRHGVPYFCDAAQWVGRLPARGLGGCDFVTGCAHKFGGPVGVGFLKCTGPLHPLLLGGPQEAGRRAGTENVPAVLSMTAALAEAEQAMATGEAAKRREWRDAFERELQRTLPEVRILGQGCGRLWNTTAALMPAVDCQQRWVVKLDKLGFAVSTGSACSSGQEKRSHVLAAMGVSPEDSGRMLRFSSGWDTAAGAWSELAAGVLEAARLLRVG